MTVNRPFAQHRNQGGKRIVFGALDWGLGHATRSVPLLRYIQQKGGQISIAASGPTAELLKYECPWAEFLDLPGYKITYPGAGGSFRHHIFQQIPKIRRAILSEGEWLRKAQGKDRWDLVISDNRYGFRLPGVPSILLTHQLAPISGMGSLADGLFRRTLYNYINRFAECWVPDMADEPSLAGQLSHPRQLPRIPVRYIGLLSRFENILPTVKHSDYLFLLSGPEPQRTLLEQRILEQWAALPGQKTLVRGLPGQADNLDVPSNCRIFNHLPSDELAAWIAGAGVVICRPGYSSIMDLLRLRRPALLIPTPGQTEQEYLAERSAQLHQFHSIAQDEVNLLQDLARVPSVDLQIMEARFGDFKKAIDAFVF